MKIKFLLLLTDNKAIIYNQNYENILTCEGNFEEINEQISSFLKDFQKISFHLLIDLKTNIIHEDTLPRLYPWDLTRYILHKKNEGKSKNGFFGFSLLKQDKTSYLRWIHIPQNDFLHSWISWFEAFPKSSGKVFFVPLEVLGLLKKPLSPPSPYQALFYSFSPQTQGYAIFKKKRLLLTRLFHHKDDFQAALHFLSRKFPDIHDKLKIYSINSNADFLPSQTIKINEPNYLLRYFFTQKKPSLKIQRRFHLSRSWIRISILSFVAVFTLMNGIFLYQAYEHKHRLPEIKAHIKTLKLHIETLKRDLGDQDLPSLQKAINAYSFLKSENTFPVKIFEKLALLLKNKPVRLEGLNIKYENGLEILLDISMKQKAAQELIKDFDYFLLSCKTTFPQGQIDVLEAPLNSAPHETFKSSFTSLLPIAKVRILLP